MEILLTLYCFLFSTQFIKFSMENPNIDYIEHPAIVVSTSKDKRTIDVRLLGKIDCVSCPASEVCKLPQSPDKTIKIVTPLAPHLKVGDEITVKGVETLPHRFLVVATVLPCLILIASMVIIFLLTFNQVLALICGVGITLIIFILIWGSRNRVAHEFQFSVSGHNNRKH